MDAALPSRKLLFPDVSRLWCLRNGLAHASRFSLFESRPGSLMYTRYFVPNRAARQIRQTPGQTCSTIVCNRPVSLPIGSYFRSYFLFKDPC
jgi:hypothetical protein